MSRAGACQGVIHCRSLAAISPNDKILAAILLVIIIVLGWLVLRR